LRFALNFMKILLIIIDGLADEPIPELNGKTPLEAAKTPHLDFLATRGKLGQVIVFKKKEGEPTSENSHLALFGYDPEKYAIGRGEFEVLASGLEVGPEDICLRGNFATLNNQGIITDRRAGRIQKTEALIKAISGIEIEGVKFLVSQSIGYRLGIVIKGQGLSPRVSDSDPHKTGVFPEQVFPLEKTEAAEFTSRILNKFLDECQRRLENHPLNKKRAIPANIILVRGASQVAVLPSFSEKYQLKAACIAGGPVYKAIGKLLGMDLINVKGANGLPNTNLRGKVIAAKQCLGRYDFVFCHFKAADSFAEDGDFLGKKRFIEKIDQNLRFLLKSRDFLLVITGDHATCSKLKRHCDLDTPILICALPAKKIKEETLVKFSEKGCQKGELGIFPQIETMGKILNN